MITNVCQYIVAIHFNPLLVFSRFAEFFCIFGDLLYRHCYGKRLGVFDLLSSLEMDGWLSLQWLELAVDVYLMSAVAHVRVTELRDVADVVLVVLLV